MKILVTGITGRVGANIANRFIENGHDVRGFVWPGDRMAENMNRVGAEIVEGDLRSHEDVMSAAAGRDTIFHLGAAFQAGGPFTPEQYFDVNVKGLFNVLEERSTKPAPERIKFGSAIWFVAKRPFFHCHGIVAPRRKVQCSKPGNECLIIGPAG